MYGVMFSRTKTKRFTVHEANNKPLPKPSQRLLPSLATYVLNLTVLRGNVIIPVLDFHVSTASISFQNIFPTKILSCQERLTLRYFELQFDIISFQMQFQLLMFAFDFML